MKFSRALESEMRNRWRRNMMPYPGSGYVPHMGPVFACRPAPFDIVLCEENFQKTRENDDSDLTQVVFLFFSFLFLFLPFSYTNTNALAFTGFVDNQHESILFSESLEDRSVKR